MPNRIGYKGKRRVDPPTKQERPHEIIRWRVTYQGEEKLLLSDGRVLERLYNDRSWSVKRQLNKGENPYDYAAWLRESKNVIIIHDTGQTHEEEEK